MRRLTRGGTFLVALAAALAVVPATALADPPTQFHDHSTGTSRFEFLCGFSGEVEYSYSGNFIGSADGTTSHGTLQYDATYTNELNGNTMRLSQAGMQTFRQTIDEEAGTLTLHNDSANAGLYTKIQTSHGPVLIRDAGLSTLKVTINLETGEVISREQVYHGPRPLAEEEVAFCDIVEDALGPLV